MKKFRTFLTAFLVMIMVLGSTMTAFAEEIVKEGTTADDLQTPAEMDVTIAYQKGSDISADKDDTTKDIINIVINYDNLDFSYEADAIKWDTVNKKYNITLKNNGDNRRNITVNNNSNTSVKMTPTLVCAETQPKGLNYQLLLLRSMLPLWGATQSGSTQVNDGSITLKWGKEGMAGFNDGNTDELTLNISKVSITSEAIDSEIAKTTIAQVSLAFENVGKN